MGGATTVSGTATGLGRATATGGLATSLAFTPVQGIEFRVDPQKHIQEVNEKYVNSLSLSL